MTPNYEKIIYYLNLAYSNCGDSFKTEDTKHAIKSLISNINRLDIKNKNKIKNQQQEANKPGNKYKYPVESIQAIDEMIEQEKRENL
jgi:hypothetical protein